MIRLRILGAVTVALATVACATTNDPYECADQGIGSVISGCPQDVAAKTTEISKGISVINADTDAVTAKIEVRKQREAELQARMKELLSELGRQAEELEILSRDLRAKRDQNRITQARYESLDADLQRVKLEIVSYQRIEPINYTQKTASDLTRFMETEIVSIKNQVKEVDLG